MEIKTPKRHYLLFLIVILFLSNGIVIKAEKRQAHSFIQDDFIYTVTKDATNEHLGTVSVRVNEERKDTIRNIVIRKRVVYNGLSYQVTCIEPDAFEQCSNLVNVVITSNVNEIGKYAFANCENLACVVIPKNVTSIAKFAFQETPDTLTVSCSKSTIAYDYARKYELNYNLLYDEDHIVQDKDRKLIIVGDSRTNNMRRWVKTTVPTAFVAKCDKGYDWFVRDGVQTVNNIKNPGDVIIVWLGVNDYNWSRNGKAFWELYADKMNRLVANEWKDCEVYVASVGYVDSSRIGLYYGQMNRANSTLLTEGAKINGIKEFNLNLKESLSKEITWIDTGKVIGIKDSDRYRTPESLWYMRKNGNVDGLHYSEAKTKEIYKYFISQTR
ncbi:MAG TPA: leucine-rich repeat protein [Lachnospiraceae bacterium]|nr:leucine-rich repeat protein [Lachnospiraceae bacterium]